MVRACVQALILLVARSARDNQVNGKGQLALHHAARKGHRECTQYLLKNMQSAIDEQDADGNTPLMLAVNADQLEIVQLLLARGANALHARDSAGVPPWCCCERVHGCCRMADADSSCGALQGGAQYTCATRQRFCASCTSARGRASTRPTAPAAHR